MIQLNVRLCASPAFDCTVNQRNAVFRQLRNSLIPECFIRLIIFCKQLKTKISRDFSNLKIFPAAT